MANNPPARRAPPELPQDMSARSWEHSRAPIHRFLLWARRSYSGLAAGVANAATTLAAAIDWASDQNQLSGQIFNRRSDQHTPALPSSVPWDSDQDILTNRSFRQREPFLLEWADSQNILAGQIFGN